MPRHHDSEDGRDEEEIMRGVTIRFEQSPRRRLAAAVVSAIVALAVAGHPQSSRAQQPSQETFPSAEAASRALYAAVQHHDEKTVMAILGAGPELIHADDIEDKLLHDQFVGKYQQMHRLVREPDDTTVLYIGAENWPFPVPLASANGAWHFDSQAGLMEVMFRRIGENETMTIQACRALVMAERRGRPRSDGADPIDALLANARRGKDPVPYNGYDFRILTAPGQNAHDRATRKVPALVAYPAEYRSSGVMTFIVGADAIVHEKDLGPNTAAVASAMTAYNPDPSWKAVGQEP
jgi:hypothetical protein